MCSHKPTFFGYTSKQELVVIVISSFPSYQMRMRELQFDEDILELKRQATGAARSNIQENIDLMRLQREVKDKSTKLTAVQAQFENLNSVCI